MRGLIGYTGFVGSNLNVQYKFDRIYNSKNILEIKNQEFDMLFCAGVSAIKWFANQNPDLDIKNINNLIECLKTVKVNKFILISTIDIYDDMNNVDEDTLPNREKQDTYGKNRYYLEQWVKDNFQNYLILRLPALFGKGLKKNFIYDLMNPIPSAIVSSKWQEFLSNIEANKFKILKENYEQDINGNYKFKQEINLSIKEDIKKIFEEYGFTSLNFTDSRSSFPFYYLDNLKRDIDLALENDIRMLNLSVEPLTCEEVAKTILNKNIKNEIQERIPVHYDMKSKYFKLYDGKNGYLYSKEQTFEYLREYFKKEGF